MCTLELHHGGWFENEVYKKGKVCYLDNIVDDFLSLLDLIKIGRSLGYDVDISQVEQSLEIKCRNVEGGLELVTSDTIVVEMVGHIPSNKVVVLYYSEIEIWAELPNEDDDSEFKDNDYEFSENEAEVRPTVGENVANEGTNHGPLGEVSSDGANTSEFDTGSETEDEEPYLGQILMAVGVDGNNGYFPVAYAVVDIESKDSWIWFFNLLIEDLGITNGRAWVVISDKQKGLVPIIEIILPTVEHMMYVRHLYNNFRASLIGLALKHILWAAARATTLP
ncbi:hypothetical protein L3X38_038982 [Prunus dulcis]|uniref:MULE transposase domain-containing protein n=1 Tax=Prunus dulcis TaxID=3755 RepID=A0AAD4V674_PRUDU|nr:hypothetical protein L3X38_038982 [Prunus dulcis]